MVQTHLPDGLLKSLITSGIIDGVGGVLAFGLATLVYQVGSAMGIGG